MTLSSIRPLAAVGLVGAALLYVGCARTYETADPMRTALEPPPAAARAAESAPAHRAVGAAVVRGEPDPALRTDPAVVAATGPVEVDAPSPGPGSTAKSAPGMTTAGKPAPPTGAKPDPLKRFAAWTAQPPGAILVVSGEQNGYLQPCGCTGGQLGGVGRRYDLMAHLRAKGWPVGAVDLGNLIHNPGSARGGPEQEKIKFDTALKALAAMKYGAVAVGPEDLKLGVAEALGQLLNQKALPFLAANLRPMAGFDDAIRPSTTLAIGPVRVGVTAVLDPQAYANLADNDKDALLTIRPPDEAIPAVLAELEKSSAVQVLMVQGPHELALTLAKAYPGFDLVVATARFDDPDERPEVVNGGRTTVVNVGRKGKYTGIVGLLPGRTPAVEFHLQPLDTAFAEAEPMRALLDDEYPAVLKAVGVVANFARTANPAYPAGASYVGAESCQSCHPNTFAKWSSTTHAHAYDALASNPRRNREADAECVSCHVTGFGYNSGFVSSQQTPFLKGNQCENCHGPGSLHNAEPDNLAYRRPMVLTAEADDKRGFCISCHNDDNDPHFQFAPYYAQIFHKGLDTYDDPKVHQGKPAKLASRTKRP